MIIRHQIGTLLKKLGLYETVHYAFTPHGHIRNFIFFPIMGYLRTKGIGFKADQRILELKDKHKGERAFVIATGPSLTVEDVNLISNETTFAVNSIFKLFDQTDWRPNYYVFLDPILYDRFYDRGYVNLDSFCKNACFLFVLNRKKIKSSKAYILHVNWLNHITNFGSTYFKFNEDFRFGLYDYYSVTQLSILLAMYMGYKDIYLLGVDNNYIGEKTHFQYTEGESKISKNHGYRIQNANDSAYKVIKALADERGVNIYNATRGGRLDVFPRVNLDELMK